MTLLGSHSAEASETAGGVRTSHPPGWETKMCTYRKIAISLLIGGLVSATVMFSAAANAKCVPPKEERPKWMDVAQDPQPGRFLQVRNQKGFRAVTSVAKKANVPWTWIEYSQWNQSRYFSPKISDNLRRKGGISLSCKFAAYGSVKKPKDSNERTGTSYPLLWIPSFRGQQPPDPEIINARFSNCDSGIPANLPGQDTAGPRCLPDSRNAKKALTKLKAKFSKTKNKFNRYDYDRPQPERVAVDITGTYHADYSPTKAGYKGNRVVLQINQAGRFAKLWYRQYVPKKAPAGQWPRTKVLKGVGSAWVHSQDKERTIFHLKVRLNDRTLAGIVTADHVHDGYVIQVKVGNSKSWSYYRKSMSPRIAKATSDTFADQELKKAVESIQNRPLLEDEFNDVVFHYMNGSDGSGGKDSLFGLIRKYKKDANTNRARRRAEDIEVHYWEKIISKIPESLLPLVNAEISYQLGRQSPDQRRTYLEWLSIMCNRHGWEVEERMTCDGVLWHFQDKGKRVYSSQKNAVGKKHLYEWAFSGVGFGGGAIVGGNYYRGTMRIRKVSPDRWEMAYPAFIGGVGISIGESFEGLAKFATGTLESAYDWDQENFLGYYQLNEGTVISIQHISGEKSVEKATIIFFDKDEELPPLKGDASTEMWLGFGVSGGPSVLLGEIYKPGDKKLLKRKLDLLAAKNTKIKKIKMRYAAANQTHFGVDKTSLTKAGREMIREFLAVQLPVLMHPDSQLTIEGHASPRGRRDHNRELSLVRAMNVLQAMDDVSGPKIRIAVKNIQVMGYGEEVAAVKLRNDDMESEDWRRVDIKLDGKLVMTLKAPAGS